MANVWLNTGCGAYIATVENGTVIGLSWPKEKTQADCTPRSALADADNSAVFAVEEALNNYAKGQPVLPQMLPLRFAAGTKFQQKVWRALMDIPFGQTTCYGDLAKALKSGPRAVGGAVGKNPLPVLVPCHRVVGMGGKLGGFSGGEGISTKQWLLEHEKEHNKNA